MKQPLLALDTFDQASSSVRQSFRGCDSDCDSDSDCDRECDRDSDCDTGSGCDSDSDCDYDTDSDCGSDSDTLKLRGFALMRQHRIMVLARAIAADHCISRTRFK